MVSKVSVAGDPNSFAGASEHSHQVALMAACAHYAKYFRDEAIAWAKGADVLMSEGKDALISTELSIKYHRLSAALEWLHAVPNGGTRGGDKRSAIIAGANMKAEGLKRGVYDVHLPVARHGYHSFWIEMKAPGVIKRAPDGSVRNDPKGKPMDGRSDEQIEFGRWIATEGSLAAVFDSWWGAMRAIMWYLDFAHCLEWELPQ